MIIEEDSVELASKAYELESLPKYALILAESYVRANLIDKAKDLFESIIKPSEDPKLIFYYYFRVFKDPTLLEYLHERDPRSEKLTIDLMEF